MIKFTGNFARITIECGAFPFEVSSRDWLISIADKNHPDVDVPTEFGRILFIDFDDAEHPRDGHCITDEDADIIAAFIKDAMAQDANVWVNCHAGICRSGAVVEVLKMLGWVVVEHHLVAQRIPNVLVKNKLRRRFPQLINSWDFKGE